MASPTRAGGASSASSESDRSSPESDRSSSGSPARFVFLVADLAGFARAFGSHSDEEMCAFLDDFYVSAEMSIGGRGGRIVKFIGDAVLAVFPGSDAPRAVAAAVELEREVTRLTEKHAINVGLGANVHLGTAVMRELGAGESRRLDVIGRAVNQTFLLGRGSGVRISEPVYRQLPSSERSPWEKRKPPAVYVLGDGGGAHAAFGKNPAENAERW